MLERAIEEQVRLDQQGASACVSAVMPELALPCPRSSTRRRATSGAIPRRPLIATAMLERRRDEES